MNQVVGAAKKFLNAVIDHPGLSMIIVAGPIESDPTRSGYGCGKTMLSQIIHQANSSFRYAAGLPESLMVTPKGNYFEARQLMALFDGNDFRPSQTFGNFGNLVVIDDVGREGNLRFERRDADNQAEEKIARYYNVIDWCYSRKIGVIMTSNMSATELSQFLGGASWSRLLQMSPKRYRLNLTGVRDMRPLLAETIND